ncbi:MAG: SDR family NAD(P)-dependent oxidoreductase [Oscillospiraceae bacterium]|nr:SDR family NAD(P)-dependent oxidoreductase [Oscillospiraceae bacterium]
MNDPSVALVSGGSSGIGLSCAEALLRAGWRVYTLSRRGGGPENAVPLAGDVTDPAQCAEAVRRVSDECGRLDLLVNCAGFGISGAAEFTPMEEARRQLEVNLLGTANLCSAAIPVFREQKRGRIINISSVAAVTPIPFQAWYSASKAGINSYTMALANEVRRFGVSVCAVMPGDTRTGFTDAREKSAAGDEVYGGAVSRSVSRMEKDERGGVSPDKVARKVLRLAQKKRVGPLHAVGFVYGLCVLLMRILPSGLANRILGMLYAN